MDNSSLHDAGLCGYMMRQAHKECEFYLSLSEESGEAVTIFINLILWLKVLVFVASCVYLLASLKRALGSQSLAARLRALIAYLREMCIGSKDPFEILVQQAVESRRLERAKVCAKFAVPFFSVLALSEMDPSFSVRRRSDIWTVLVWTLGS